jgi:hypothetical protein
VDGKVKYTLFDWISLESGTWADWFSGTMSALAVAVALGGYGYSIWQQRRQQADAERQAMQQVALKLLTIHSRNDDIKRHVWQTYGGPALEGPDANQLWRTIHPLIGLRDTYTTDLNPPEVSLLMKMKASDFMLELMLAAERLHSTISAMRDYQARYEAIYAMMPPAQGMSGPVGQHTVTIEEYNRLQPYSFALEQLIQSIRKMTKEDAETGRQLIARFNTIVLEHFGRPIVELEPITAENN